MGLPTHSSSFDGLSLVGDEPQPSRRFPTAPHLHFQLMDSPDLMTAKGVPCAFRSYEVLRGDRWQKVENGIPSSADRIRYAGTGL